jgi:aryl-alcohol dehydrogenase-like predicted oxidoreductase
MEGRVMQRRQLGSSGPTITKLGLGAWAIGGPYSFGWGPQDDDESIKTIRYAIERGVNWVDTAAVYGFGHSEEVVGRAVEPLNPGEDVLVFTKCGLNWYGKEEGTFTRDLRPESIRFECEQSLKRMNLERIDLYQIHWPDPTTGTRLEDSWGAMSELVDEGKVRWIGVSNFDVDMHETCESIRHVDSTQPPLSLVNPAAASDVIPWADEHGTGVLLYSPMASGLLTGKYDRDSIDSLAPDDWRRKSPNFTEPLLTRNLDLIGRIKPVAERLNINLATLAIAWTLSVPGVTSAIVGARSPEQVDGWLPAADVELPGDALKEIQDALSDLELVTDAR